MVNAITFKLHFSWMNPAAFRYDGERYIIGLDEAKRIRHENMADGIESTTVNINNSCSCKAVALSVSKVILSRNRSMYYTIHIIFMHDKYVGA